MFFVWKSIYTKVADIITVWVTKINFVIQILREPGQSARIIEDWLTLNDLKFIKYLCWVTLGKDRASHNQCEFWALVEQDFFF